jgi:hypothetical protein
MARIVWRERREDRWLRGFFFAGLKASEAAFGQKWSFPRVS